MRALKLFIGLLLAIVAVVVGGGLLLPDTVHVERSIAIDRPPAQIYQFLNGFQRFEEWSPWDKDFDPTTVVTLSGPPSGPGARMDWKGEKSTGAQWITEVVENRKIQVALDFGANGKATAAYVLEPSGAGTRVTWGFDSNFEGNLIGRWMGLMFDKWIGADYEKGLAKMKQVIEAEPPPAPVNADEAPAAEGETSAESTEPAPAPV